MRGPFGQGSSRVSYDRLNGVLLRQEQRFSPWLWGLILSFLMLLAACLYVRPALHCTALGVQYAKLATHPFDTSVESPVGLRRLTPMISYALGLRGEGIIITNLLFALLLLWAVCAWARRTLPQPGDAFFTVLIIAFSMTTLSTIYFGGYCDSLTYLLLFLMWRSRGKPLLFSALLFLSLLNRESIVFLIPWFLYLSFGENRRGRWTIAVQVFGIGAVLVLYAFYRAWMQHDGTALLGLGRYLAPMKKDLFLWIRPAIANWGVGLFSVYKLFWILPVLTAVVAHRSGETKLVRSMVLLVLCAAGQLVFAFDSSRLLTMAYPVMIVALARLFADDSFAVRKWIGWLALANLAVPQIHTAARVVEIMYSPLAAIAARITARALAIE